MKHTYPWERLKVVQLRHGTEELQRNRRRYDDESDGEDHKAAKLLSGAEDLKEQAIFQ